MTRNQTLTLIAAAILCTNLTGCGTIPSYEDLGNGYVEATYIRTSSWEPTAIRTQLRYKKGLGTIVIWLEFQESGVIDIHDYTKSKCALIYGQMTEPPGARLRVGLTGLTVAEYFRDEEGQDVLLFIDNIFRFTQAGSEVSALLGRMPSAVGYQPNLATEMGELQQRITST